MFINMTKQNTHRLYKDRRFSRKRTCENKSHSVSKSKRQTKDFPIGFWKVTG